MLDDLQVGSLRAFRARHAAWTFRVGAAVLGS